MAQGTTEARAYMEGERKGYKVTLLEMVAVRVTRKKLHLSQDKFADTFGFPSMQYVTGSKPPHPGSHHPPLLTVIAHNLKTVLESLSQHHAF